MAVVWIPPQLRTLTNGEDRVTADGTTVGRVIDALERAFPGLRALLCDDDRIRSDIAISVDGEITQLGLLQPVRDDSEIHIVPAIGGGAP